MQNVKILNDLAFQHNYLRLKAEFRDHFYNITRIMDCVACDKCKLWGKLQVPISYFLIGFYSFSSRKVPEFMNFLLIKCKKCFLIYANNVPSDNTIFNLYNKSSLTLIENSKKLNNKKNHCFLELKILACSLARDILEIQVIPRL